MQSKISFIVGSTPKLNNMNIKTAKVIRSEDGYTFHKQLDGSWTDTEIAANSDMSYASDLDLIEAIKSEHLSFLVVKDLRSGASKG